MIWNLSIKREIDGGVAVLRLAGRLGHAGARELEKTLAGLLEAGQCRLVLELSGVEYASGAALLTLGAAADRVRDAGGVLVLCAISDPVRVSFDLAGLLPRFTVADSVASAVDRLMPAAPGARPES